MRAGTAAMTVYERNQEPQYGRGPMPMRRKVGVMLFSVSLTFGVRESQNEALM
jgi:hypothetical protein